jgi:hypothetical protein
MRDNDLIVATTLGEQMGRECTDASRHAHGAQPVQPATMSR